MRTLKLMADYDCWPLWESKPDELDNIDPRRLPISTELAADLVKWSEDHDAILNKDDPASSGFTSREAQEQWIERGATLAERLRAELGSNYAVIEHRYE